MRDKFAKIKKFNFFRSEKAKVFFFFTVLTVIFTWPVFLHFFSSVPTSGSDTMQVIGISGSQANLLGSEGILQGTLILIKTEQFGIRTAYAYFDLVFGLVGSFNLLFYLSFILSGFGAYLLADYFIKNKKAALLAGIIFAFSPFHFHNSLGTNVGTMHQEWLPFFALYLFKYFENFKTKYFFIASLFLLVIGLTENQLLAFTFIFVLFFVIYKLIAEPKKFLNRRLWLEISVSAVVLGGLFYFIFGGLLNVANSDYNYLDAGLDSAVKYSNDTLSIFATPPFHSFWPNAFQGLREQFERRSTSFFSVFIGYSVFLLAILGIAYSYKKGGSSIIKKGIYFWLSVAVGFYVLSLGPYLHYKGVLDPPVEMPYYLIYQYFPYYKNIRTVGRFFVYMMLAMSLLAAWGSVYLHEAISKASSKKNWSGEKNEEGESNEKKNFSVYYYGFLCLIVAFEFLAVPLKTNSLLHSSFYEKIGRDKENYNILEVPGSTDYDFASRDLVWQSIHRKNNINGLDFARINKQNYLMQRGTPIIRTLLYDIPEGDDNASDKDMMSSSYYDISNEILNYYNIRYIILDHQGLRGDAARGDVDKYYSGKAYIRSVIKCASEHEDSYIYACEVDRSIVPKDMFFAMDYSNPHWVGKSEGKSGFKRWAENGAGVKLVNMSSTVKSGKISFSAKIRKPLNLKVLVNGEAVYEKYLTLLSKDIEIKTDDISRINPGENDVIFDIRGADGSEIHSDQKSDTVVIGNIDIDN